MNHVNASVHWHYRLSPKTHKPYVVRYAASNLHCKVACMSTSGKKTKSQRRQPLERRVIAEKALELIDSDGLEALSMRRLGAALGVEAMTLYHHFRNKAELLDGVLELLVEEMEVGLVENDLPLQRLRRLFENV